MSAIDLLALAMWPLAAAGAWMGRLALAFKPRDFRRHAIGAAALVLLSGPFLTLVFLFPHHSAIVLANEYALIIAIGVLLLVVAWRTKTTRLKLLAIAVTGILLLGGGLWFLGGDFIIRRAQVDGYISDKRYGRRWENCISCLPDHYLYVSGRRYPATTRIFDSVETGQRIRAKIGRASRRILWIEARPI